VTFCEDCATRDRVEYRGKVKILTKFECFCACETKLFIYGPDGPRCETCHHLLKNPVDLYDADSWDPLWMPNGQPIRRDQVMHT